MHDASFEDYSLHIAPAILVHFHTCLLWFRLAYCFPYVAHTHAYRLPDLSVHVFMCMRCVQLDDLHAMLDNVSAERDAALGGAAAAANGEDLPAKVEAMQAEVRRLFRTRRVHT